MQRLVGLRNSPRAWGIASLCAIALLIATAAVVYVRPPGNSTVTFYTDDAASIRVGDGVRVAGIPVGKIERITIEPTLVRVDATVDDDAFIGDRSQVDVRMLTVVGGYYVNVTSLGDVPLGSTPIPKARVRMPYSLMQTLTDVEEVTENIDPAPVERGLDELGTGLSGTGADALQNMLDAANSVVSVVSRQRGQVSRILSVSDEYLASLNGFRGQLVELIRKAAILEQTLVTYGDGFSGALLGLGEVGQRAATPIGTFYGTHREQVLDVVEQLLGVAGALENQTEPMIEGLRGLRERMQQVLTAAGGEADEPTLLATDLCIPLPGKPC